MDRLIENQLVKQCNLREMITYSFGDCANSLITNSLFAFAMLYYTEALGLSPSLAGIAFSSAMLWDATIDPIIGHISDNTCSRFGRRHPYILLGGISMALVFYFLWYVPDIFKTSNTAIFVYLLVMNILLRTTYAVFIIPYTALGFEICSDYNGRTKLQGIKNAMNMAANFCGPALAWWIFFDNNQGIRATKVSTNYISMGVWFSAATIVFVVIVVFTTLPYISHLTSKTPERNSIKAFFINMKEIICDYYPRWVFAFTFIVYVGIVMVSGLQMYLYEHFMKFGGVQKTIAHGGTMIGMGLGALAASLLTRMFDKKGAVIFGVLLSVLANGVLAILFLPGVLKPGQTFLLGSTDIPIAFIAFVFFHSAFWFGNGIMAPISTSMMADVSEIYQIKTGINKDGAYSAVFVFAMKYAISLGTLIMGFSLSAIGFQKDIVPDQIIAKKLCALCLLGGPVICLISLITIYKYPVTKQLLENIRSCGTHLTPEYVKNSL